MSVSKVHVGYTDNNNFYLSVDNQTWIKKDFFQLIQDILIYLNNEEDSKPIGNIKRYHIKFAKKAVSKVTKEDRHALEEIVGLHNIHVYSRIR